MARTGRASDDDFVATFSRLPSCFVEQARLADAALARNDEESGCARERALDTVHHGLELRAAPDQP
jgi:hypothetical protein